MKNSFGLFSPVGFLLSAAIAVTSGYSTPALSQGRQSAVVFDPPSNVRSSPNGKVICSVGAVSNINIYGSTQGWYVTDVCGPRGYIHNSQIRLQSSASGQTIPARFHGRWVEDLRYCRQLTDTSLEISASRIDFWESFGTVRSVKAQGTSDLYVTANVSSEGENFSETVHFRLSNNQKTLTTIGDDGSQFTRYRCR